MAKRAKGAVRKARKKAGGLARSVKKAAKNPRRTVRKAAKNVHKTAVRARDVGETVVGAGQMIKETADFVDSFAQRAASRTTRKKK